MLTRLDAPHALLSPAQAARRLGLSGQRVRQLADRGTLPSIRTALGRLLDATAVDELAAQRQTRRGATAPLPPAA
jgi:excisionase family DNA binding protein